MRRIRVAAAPPILTGVSETIVFFRHGELERPVLKVMESPDQVVIANLRDLERRLVENGWRIVYVLPGDGYGVSGTWEIQRGSDERWFIDFDGLTEEGVARPMEEAYGCTVRGTRLDAYFGRQPSDRRPRGSWEREAAALVAGLENG